LSNSREVKAIFTGSNNSPPREYVLGADNTSVIASAKKLQLTVTVVNNGPPDDR
jgi:hypothetical protein